MPKQIYFIAIIPPASVCEQITKFRKLFLPDFNLHSEHKKFPHITIQHTFRKLPEIENDLITNLNQLASTLPSFSVSVSGIDHFDKRIIYISVINNPALQKLFSHVQQLLLEQFHFNQEEISKTFTPHITLEKKLTPELFERGWSAIQNRECSITFMVENFSLLKHNRIRWEPLAHFNLNR